MKKTAPNVKHSKKDLFNGNIYNPGEFVFIYGLLYVVLIAFASLEKRDDCQKVEIIQTYLKAGENEEVRVRQRGANGSYIYCKTVKKKLTDTTRIETEERLSQEKYLKLLMDADTSMHQIRKTRYCLTYESQYFEIDIYPFWQDRAIVEIELLTEQDEIRMPKFLKVIREVTDDASYKNAALAKAVCVR